MLVMSAAVIQHHYDAVGLWRVKLDVFFLREDAALVAPLSEQLGRSLGARGGSLNRTRTTPSNSIYPAQPMAQTPAGCLVIR